jgi:L-malate glycosyltransferase
MNIGIVGYPTYGGSGVVATELSKGLAKRGHNVHFMSYARPQRLDVFDSNITFHEVSINAYPLFEYPPYDLALASHMVNLIEYQKLDLLHVHYAIPHTTSAFLAKQIMGKKAAHVPIITTLHGTDITIVGSDPSYLPVVNFSINQSDGVTAVSGFLRDETFMRFEIDVPIEVIPNFVDLTRFRRSVKEHYRKAIVQDGEKIITHVSNFRKVKRVQDVAEAFARVLDAGVRAKLLFVGDGPEKPSVEALCRELGCCEHVRFLGKQENVEDILSLSDVFMMTSTTETFGLAALEAMSCGVPVVSSDVGGLPELNRDGETGYVCPLGDVQAMADRIVAMFSDDDLHKRMQLAARARAEQFDQEVVVEQYEAYYERIVEKVRKRSGVTQ